MAHNDGRPGTGDTNNLIDAFGDIDLETKAFLIEALEGAIEFEETWEPLLEPFLEDNNTSRALAILASNPVDAVQEAKASLESRKEQRTSDLVVSTSRIIKVSPFDCFRNPRQTQMDGAHNRGISLKQLRLVVAYIEQQADDEGYLPWKDWSPKSPTNGFKLHVNTVNLYHVVDCVIKPTTRQFQCSLVEILSEAKQQRPRWFVSHVWCEPVKNFLSSIEEHARVRGLSETDCWWVCGYANNQHSLDEDINIDPDPRKTSFYRAMQQCEGVLLCLDAIAKPFSRIWCCFEEAMIVNDGEKNLLLDISTVVNGKGVVLTDGLVESDQTHGPKFALEAKRERESDFPLHLLEKGYQIDIRQASASHEPDIGRILNAIAGVSAEKLGSEPPDLSHPQFEKTNQALRGIFAEAAARKAAEAGRLELLLKVLREDIDRKTLTLNLGGCQNLDLASLSVLAGHPNLERIIIDCAYCSLPNMSWIGIALTQLPHLQELSFDLSGCIDIAASSFSHLAGIPSLKKLEIDLSYSSISDVTGIGAALSGLSRLQELKLYFTCCSKLIDVAPLSSGLAVLATLKDLKLNFRHCDLEVNLSGLEKLHELESLWIDYSYTQTGTKGRGLYYINHQSNVRKLTLLFEGCRQLRHLAHFSEIGNFKKLEELELNFAYSNVKNASETGNLYKAPRLTRVNLNFAKCPRLQDVAWLPQAVSGVTELRIDLSECRGLPKDLQRDFDSFEDLTAASPLEYLATLDQPKVGEKVKVFSPEEKRWLPAEIKTIDDESTTVEILRSNGLFLGRQMRIPKSKQRERIRPQARHDARDD